MPWQSEHDAVWAGCSIEHDGHFQIGPAGGLAGRGGDILNIGAFVIVFVVVVFDFSIGIAIIEDFDGWVGTKCEWLEYNVEWN